MYVYLPKLHDLRKKFKNEVKASSVAVTRQINCTC